MKFELNNARKDVRYYTHLAESLGVPTRDGRGDAPVAGAGVCARLRQQAVPSLVEAQEKLAGVKIVPR